MTFPEAIEKAKTEAAALNKICYLKEGPALTWELCDSPVPSVLAVHPDGATIPLSRHALYLLDRYRKEGVVR